MEARKPLLGAAAVRTVYGFVSLFAPGVLLAAARIRPPAQDARQANALFGGRDLTVAGMTVALVRAGREREALLINASCEATDLLALAQELRLRPRIDTALVLGVLFNMGGWLSCSQAARALRG